VGIILNVSIAKLVLAANGSSLLSLQKMISLFLGLTGVNLICLIITAILGYISMSRPLVADLHVLAGAMTAIACCAVHCVVFTYFIATAKWIRHAVLVKQLQPELIEPTRSFKAQAFPAAIAAIGIVFITAFCGAAVANYGLNILWHHLLALLAIAVNVLVAGIEYSAIRKNAELIDRVLAIIATQENTPAERGANGNG
jgi:hypothetical protein